jgi:membrane fusion protein (multidrug efflux system)
VSAFSQSFRVLEADRPRASFAAIAAASVLASAWLAWFVFGSVPVYEATDTARIEVYDAAHSVEAPVAAQVQRYRMVVGEKFKNGDVLVELDATLERAKLEEERAALLALEPEIAALRRQLAAQERAFEQEAEALGSAIAEAQTNEKGAELLATFASTEAERATVLHGFGVLPELDKLRREADARQKAVARDASMLTAQRAERERRARGSSGKVALEALRRELVGLEGRQRVLEAGVSRWQAEVSKRVMKAPIDGSVAEALPLVAGAYVHEGQRLGSLVPAARLKIVASFSEAAIGRVQPGQPAQLRLTGFSWVEFGTLPATVLRAASEVRDGHVRVELEPRADARLDIPLQHGLPGSAEVLVERVSPLWLVFRNAGRYLGRPAGTGGGGAR